MSPLHPGDRVTLTYCYVEQKPYPGTVVKATKASLHLHLDSETGDLRFFNRNGQWRSEFGRAVVIAPVLGIVKV